MIKRLSLYIAVYIVVTLVMSYDEVQCALGGEELCWYNLIGKFVIFIALVFAFDKFIRPKIFGNK